MAAWIAGTGENLLFVYFTAHFGILAFLVLLVGLLVPTPFGIGFAVFCCLLTAVKEFWFDLKYETNPPQTLLDSKRDYAGYLAGVSTGLIAFLVMKFYLNI